MSAAPILRVADLSVRLAGNLIIDGATLDLRPGELTLLVGPNGAGKTTLMRALAGLLPSEGTIALQDRPLAAFSVRDRARHIAYLPQGHIFHWPMNVAAVVALGRHPHADAFTPLADEDRAAVARAIAATAIEPWAARAVTTLSGGERARVALARALGDTGAGPARGRAHHVARSPPPAGGDGASRPRGARRRRGAGDRA